MLKYTPLPPLWYLMTTAHLARSHLVAHVRAEPSHATLSHPTAVCLHKYRAAPPNEYVGRMCGESQGIYKVQDLILPFLPPSPSGHLFPPELACQISCQPSIIKIRTVFTGFEQLLNYSSSPSCLLAGLETFRNTHHGPQLPINQHCCSHHSRLRRYLAYCPSRNPNLHSE